MNDDENKVVMEDLQTPLINAEDTLSNAPVVLDEEQGTDAGDTLRIVVMDEVREKGEQQPNQYRDAPFAILFVLHLIAISFFAFAWGLPAFFSSESSSTADNGTTDDNLNLAGLLGLCFLSTLAAIGILAGTVAFMIRFAEILIQFSLISSISFSLVFVIIFAINGMVGPAVLYALLFALGAGYACCVWRRIPFARANLVTATTAIKTNLGIMGVAFGLVAVLMVWSFLWVLSYGGIYMHTRTCHQDGDCDEGGLGQFVGVLYLLSFYWTSEVIKNVLVVTVAGVVGTWWFAPNEASSFCSTAIVDSVSRATSYSFGSICFGSLLMAIIQVLHQMINQARQQGRGNDLLLCILECLVSCLESIAEYFNKFACIYIGLYGYDYLTAGKKVMQLFANRGWTTIINDQLVYRVLNLMTLVVAGLTGCVGMLIAYCIPGWVDSLGDSRYIVAFLLPFVIGAALAHVVVSLDDAERPLEFCTGRTTNYSFVFLPCIAPAFILQLGVVASATDTVIVCFAESPNEFQANHPELSQHMLEAWRQMYPSLGF